MKKSPPKKSRPLSKKVNFVCSGCGSDQVQRDAWASWNVTRQKWELSAVFDYAHCDVCDGETSLKEV